MRYEINNETVTFYLNDPKRKGEIVRNQSFSGTGLSEQHVIRLVDNTVMKYRGNDWRIASGETVASILNITEFRLVQGKPDFKRLRFNPTLDEALSILWGMWMASEAVEK